MFDAHEHSPSTKAGAGDQAEALRMLEAENDRLHGLVCYLLHVNEQLRLLRENESRVRDDDPARREDV